MQHLLRRKINLIIIAILLLPIAGFSQLRYSPNLPDHDEKFIRFGINLGYNKSHFNFSTNPSFLTFDSITVVESLNSSGINLAWLVNINLNEHFDFRTYPLNLTFTEKAFEYILRTPDPFLEEKITMTKKVQSIMLSLPVQIKFSSDRIDNFKVYAIGGGRFDYDLAANEGKTNTDKMIALNKFNLSLETGIGFHLYFPYFVLSPELKVSWGLSNLHHRNENFKYSSVIDKINSRMISFSLTVE